MPFEEIPHTADVSLHVWATDLPSIFTEAARGMYSLAGAFVVEKPDAHRILKLAAIDKESLLVSFLSELIFIIENEGIIFQEIQLNIHEGKHKWKLESSMMGHSLASFTKTIKAVTFHNLAIKIVHGQCDATIVFDV